MSDLGKYIRKLRKSRKIPLKTVAQAVGKSVPYISDIELGRRGFSNRVSAELLIKFADFFAVPVTVLMEKGGFEVESSNTQYRQLVKVLRNKSKAVLVGEKLDTISELLSELEVATQGSSSTNRIVKSLMVTRGELAALLLKAS